MIPFARLATLTSARMKPSRRRLGSTGSSRFAFRTVCAMLDDPWSRWAIAALLVSAYFLAACGSSAPSKRDVIARGDAICETAFRDAQTIPPPAASTARGPSLSALADYLRRVKPIVDTEVAGLRALPHPAQDRALLDRYIAAMTASEAQYSALSSAAARDDEAGVASALAALRASPASSLAASYGFGSCAESATTATGS